ncbi:hypothetical protein EHH44_20980 [Mycolicibacter terrae]|uniref:Integral membrane protein n=2 Tax=Mycolicibacter TaxID=1073531 RepID=A0A1A2XKJ6_MYCSD|nr:MULTISPECIES: hypothetical protein [Mycolicibacter]OBH19609.1 hypothetical protein A5694_18175 [Mycolicibacter sinensis]OBI26240.1 hypothetical protein A5710_07330 [Mycolicibacter sinensis]RRR40125.1 hypothetical protein EHH44_20980 [Mycolicibacter terrae]
MTAITTRVLSDSTDSLLRFALRADAAVTGVIGLAGLFAARPMAALTGLTPAHEYALAAFCVLYGAVVYVLAALPEVRRAGIGVIAANLACTVAAVAVLEAGVLPLTGVGVAAMLASAAYTASFAVAQYRGLRRLR